jgi:hypothetical protein
MEIIPELGWQAAAQTSSCGNYAAPGESHGIMFFNYFSASWKKSLK